MKAEKSCWGVVFRTTKWTIEYLLVQQKQGDHRFFPKWHVEGWESEKETALREIKEEVWLDVRIIEGFKDSISYIDYTKLVDKTVVFFLCEAMSDDISLQDELQDVVRFPYENALKRLTHKNSRKILDKANDFLLSLQ